jgi:hypothetical protein
MVEGLCATGKGFGPRQGLRDREQAGAEHNKASKRE